MNDITRGVFEIAMAMVSLAGLTLLIGHSSGTKTVIQSATSGFNSLLQTLTLQNSGSVGNLSNWG